MIHKEADRLPPLGSCTRVLLCLGLLAWPGCGVAEGTPQDTSDTAGAGGSGGSTGAGGEAGSGGGDDCPLGRGEPVRIVDIAGGAAHMLAITSRGDIYCWGSDDYYQCGPAGGQSTVRTATRLESPRCATSVTARSSSKSFAVLYGGDVAAWGLEFVGERGDGPEIADDQRAPSTVLLPEPAIAVEAWVSGFAATGESGTSYLWGDVWPNEGPGPSGAITTPTVSSFAPEIATRWNVCKLDENRRAWCRGRNDYGQVGDGTQEERRVFVPVAGDLEFSYLAGDGLSVIGVDTGGRLLSWGDNRFLRLGLGTEDPSPVLAPEPVGGGHGKPEELVVGSASTCARDRDGQVWCWGVVSGAGNSGATLSPERLPALEPAAKVVVGRYYSCSLKTDSTVWCVGDPDVRGLGWERPDPDEPTRVPFDFEQTADGS